MEVDKAYLVTRLQHSIFSIKIHLHKFYHWGISGVNAQWINSCLENCKQKSEIVPEKQQLIFYSK